MEARVVLTAALAPTRTVADRIRTTSFRNRQKFSKLVRTHQNQSQLVGPLVMEPSRHINGLLPGELFGSKLILS